MRSKKLEVPVPIAPRPPEQQPVAQAPVESAKVLRAFAQAKLAAFTRALESSYPTLIRRDELPKIISKFIEGI